MSHTTHTIHCIPSRLGQHAVKLRCFLAILVFSFIEGCDRPKATSSVLSPGDKQGLNESLVLLDTSLLEHAPFIHAKMAPPASEDDLSELWKELDGNKVQVLEMWFRWHNGCVDRTTDLLPLGRMLSISETLADRREIQDIPFVDAKRKTSLKILDDGAGDGFFLDVSSAQPRVFYHMLEDPFPRDYGSLENFVRFIVEVHSDSVFSEDANGAVDFDLDEYHRIESKYLQKLAEPELSRPGE